MGTKNPIPVWPFIEWGLGFLGYISNMKRVGVGLFGFFWDTFQT